MRFKRLKPFVLLSLLLTCSAIAAPENKTDDASKLKAQGISKYSYALANEICSDYVGDASEVGNNVKNSVIRHMQEYENITNPTPTEMVKFLNRNKHYMMCGNTHS